MVLYSYKAGRVHPLLFKTFSHIHSSRFPVYKISLFPNSYILIPPHPPQLLPHIQLIPLLRPPLNLPTLTFKDRRRTPLRLLPARLDPIVRFAAMAPFSRVPQEHHGVFREDVVVGHNMQVGDGGHDVRVRVRVVEGRVACWEGCGGGEGAVGGAELGFQRSVEQREGGEEGCT